MRSSWRTKITPLILDGGIHMPYSWTVGRVGSRFFIELRDKGRIMGAPCMACHEVWVPPRRRCPLCLREIAFENWIEVGPQGTLQHKTIVHYRHEAQPVAPPYGYGIILLDKASRAMVHFVHARNLDALKPGVRVKPVFKERRQGSILDIAYFTPAGGEP